MKILSITAQKPHSTGSGTYLTELVRSWDRQGHMQAVICGIYPDDTVDFPEGVTCYPVFFSESGSAQSAPSLMAAPCKAKGSKLIEALPFPVVGMSDIMPYESTLYRDLTPVMISEFEDAFISAAGRAVADLDPDIIVCHHLFLLTALIRKHFPGRKVYGISHGTDLRQMVNCDNLRDLVRPHIAELDGILALHSEQRHTISEIFGVDQSRITVIGSGYNSSMFNADGRRPKSYTRTMTDMTVPVMVCYAGKMSRPKGVPELLEALHILNKDREVPEFEVTLAGGCQDEYVEGLISDLPDNIRWVGQIPQERLAQIFRFSDIFVLPSYFEGLPLVLIEAMASGMIPVSTDLPGVREWIDANVPGSNAVFIPMPEMKSIDTPTDAGRASLVRDLAAALKDIVIRISQDDGDLRVPDTSAITWDSVAGRILSLNL